MSSRSKMSPRIEFLEDRCLMAVDIAVAVSLAGPASHAVKPGQSASIAITITNLGDAKLNATIPIDLSAGLNADGSAATVSFGTLSKGLHLEPGVGTTFHVAKPIPKTTVPGAYYFQIDADPANTLGETTLSNNDAVATTPLTVLPPYPVISGLFEGSDKILNGIDKGDLVPSSLDFVSEDQTTGAIVADGILYNAEHVQTATYTFDGFITKTGGITGKAFNTNDDGIVTTYTGHFAKGVFKANLKNTEGQKGIFTLTSAPN